MTTIRLLQKVLIYQYVAEAVRFELTSPFRDRVFQTRAIDQTRRRLQLTYYNLLSAIIFFMSFNRQKYLSAVKSQLEPNIVNHSLAVEACMAQIYDYLKSQNQLGADEPPQDDWLLAGLIHDIDYSAEFKESHPAKTKEALIKYNLEISDSVDQIIKAHSPERTSVQPQNKAQWALFCLDSLTGLITATALIYPSKKLAEVKVSSVIKRFLKQPKFAAGTRRDDIAKCANPAGLNIPLEKFIELCLVAMQKIAPQLGL